MTALLKTSDNPTENHQVVNDDPDVSFSLLSGPEPRANVRSEAALVATKGAFNLPTLSEQALEKSSFHLAPVFLRGPFSSLHSALDGNKTVGFQFVSDQLVELFGVATSVPNDPSKVDATVSLTDHGGSFECIARRADAHTRTNNQVGVHVDARGKFGPTRNEKCAFASSGAEIKRGVPDLKPGAVANHLGVGRRSDRVFERWRRCAGCNKRSKLFFL